MSSSNPAARLELAAPDLPLEPQRPALQIISNSGPLPSRNARLRPSLEFRTIVIRDQGFRTFRVF